MSPAALDPVIEGHLGPRGPVAPARRWINGILVSRDLGRSWPDQAVPLRERLVDAWAQDVSPNRRLRQQLRDEVLAGPSSGAAWRHFAATTLLGFRAGLRHVDLSHWTFTAKPRAIAPDREQVLLIDARGIAGPGPHHFVPAVTFEMALEDQAWKVADLRA